jgi:UDP-glucose 4-epimerase
VVVWISGAAGKLGQEVVSSLRASATRFIATDLVAGQGVLQQLNLLDYAATVESMTGASTVLHLAAHPSPEGVEPSWLVYNNVMATFNVLEAAAHHHVERVVLASSGSIYGTAWSPTLRRPSYVPIDEESPLDFVDPYALSKDLSERTGQMFARSGMSVIALRFHWVLRADELRTIWDTTGGEDGARNLWGYIELADAARACTLALTAAIPGGSFHPLVIAAADTTMSRPTAELLDEWFPGLECQRELPGRSSAFNCTRARELIGWQPRFQW